jgi:hypothetical protein
LKGLKASFVKICTNFVLGSFKDFLFVNSTVS